MMKIQWTTVAISFLVMCSLTLVCLGEDKPAETAVVNTNNTAASGPRNLFQPSTIDPALVRQNMQARSEYEEINRKIIARMNALYEDNKEIADLQSKMKELQKKIDALLAEDKELTELKKKMQTIAPEIPTMPRRSAPPPPPPSSTQK